VQKFCLSRKRLALSNKQTNPWNYNSKLNSCNTPLKKKLNNSTPNWKKSSRNKREMMTKCANNLKDLEILLTNNKVHIENILKWYSLFKSHLQTTSEKRNRLTACFFRAFINTVSDKLSDKT